MTRHLQAAGRPRPRRLESRAEIDEWAAEHFRTLTALVEAERRSDEHDRVQLELEEAA